MLRVVPCQLDEANAFIREHHRHHGTVVGHKYSIACADESGVVGVAVVGRPVSRMLDDGFTLEVTRLATDGTRNACSILYSAAWRAAKAMGYRRIVTYILSEESGSSLGATGWKCIAETSGGSWDRQNRPRVDKHPTQAKMRYEMSA